MMLDNRRVLIFLLTQFVFFHGKALSQSIRLSEEIKNIRQLQNESLAPSTPTSVENSIQKDVESSLASELDKLEDVENESNLTLTSPPIESPTLESSAPSPAPPPKESPSPTPKSDVKIISISPPPVSLAPTVLVAKSSPPSSDDTEGPMNSVTELTTKTKSVAPTPSITTQAPTRKKKHKGKDEKTETPPPKKEGEDDDWFHDDTVEETGKTVDENVTIDTVNQVNITNMTMQELVIYEAEQNEQLVIIASAALLSLLLMVFTASQVKDNPNGLWAGCCRLLVLIFAFFCKIIFLPCYLICCRCGRQRERDRSQAVPISDDYRHDLDLEMT